MLSPTGHRAEVRLCNRLDELDRLHALVAQFSSTNRLSTEIAFALSLAIEELVTNVILHGYDDAAEHVIVVSLSLDAGAVVVEMEDDGRSFDSTRAPAVDLSLDPQQRRIGGLGLHFVRSTMDEMTYHRRGNRNHLLMKKRIGETI
ncbi:MAG: ATP-binding protein [Candidatus Binatia bacterium]